MSRLRHGATLLQDGGFQKSLPDRQPPAEKGRTMSAKIPIAHGFAIASLGGGVLAGVVLVLTVALGAGAASGASPEFKQHAFAISSGKFTAQVPAEWRVHARDVFTRRWFAAPVYSYGAKDPVHKSVAWSASDRLEKTGTTLADIRTQALSTFDPRFSRDGWRDMWGWENGRFRVVGDTYLTLPIGRAWRQTLLIVPSEKQGGWAARRYVREYTLDRGVIRNMTSGIAQQAFMTFWLQCGYNPENQIDECLSHNGQLAKLMRSITFVS
jgi:hypothetical protein